MGQRQEQTLSQTREGGDERAKLGGRAETAEDDKEGQIEREREERNGGRGVTHTDTRTEDQSAARSNLSLSQRTTTCYSSALCHPRGAQVFN